MSNNPTRDDARTIADLEGICWRRLRIYIPRVSTPGWDDAVEGLSLRRIVPLLETLERCARLRTELAPLWPDEAEADDPGAADAATTILARDPEPYSEPDEPTALDDPQELMFDERT